MCEGLPAQAKVLDIGCGPGMQAIAIAKALSEGTIAAVDLHQPYLDQLNDLAKLEDCQTRIRTLQADMSALPFPPKSFDLIWAEGSAYNMGFANALAAWKPLLKPGGFLAASELVWLQSPAPDEARIFFDEEYPAMSDIASIQAVFRDCGYELVGQFTLPETAWWDDYYTPLRNKLPELRTKYEGDEMGEAIVNTTAREIEIRQQFGESYGYEFFIARKP